MNESPEFSWIFFLWQMLLLSTIILWIYCLFHVSKNRFRDNDKLIWLLIVLFVPFFGSILYLVVGRKRRISE